MDEKVEAKVLADVLGSLREIGGDLAFLHRILFDHNGVEDETRKVEIALPYLQNKIDFINTMLRDYVKNLPEALREGLSESEGKP